MEQRVLRDHEPLTRGWIEINDLAEKKLSDVFGDQIKTIDEIRHAYLISIPPVTKSEYPGLREVGAPQDMLNIIMPTKVERRSFKRIDRSADTRRRGVVHEEPDTSEVEFGQRKASILHERATGRLSRTPSEPPGPDTLMFAVSSSRHKSALLARERFRMAATEQGRRHDHQNDG